jgi:hypothetical protein
MHPLVGDASLAQILDRLVRVQKEVFGELIRDDPVDLLGHRPVEASKTGLDAYEGIPSLAATSTASVEFTSPGTTRRSAAPFRPRARAVPSQAQPEPHGFLTLCRACSRARGRTTPRRRRSTSCRCSAALCEAPRPKKPAYAHEDAQRPAPPSRRSARTENRDCHRRSVRPRARSCPVVQLPSSSGTTARASGARTPSVESFLRYTDRIHSTVCGTPSASVMAGL